MASYECSLQGIIEGEAQKKAVIDRILGIAGNDSMMDLYEHEIVFTPTGKGGGGFERMVCSHGGFF